jgi:hypothetical protein
MGSAYTKSLNHYFSNMHLIIILLSVLSTINKTITSDSENSGMNSPACENAYRMNDELFWQCRTCGGRVVTA